MSDERCKTCGKLIESPSLPLRERILLLFIAFVMLTASGAMLLWTFDRIFNHYG